MFHFLQINFIPNPFIIDFGLVQVRYYGFLIAIGIIIGLFLADKEAKRQKLDSEIIFDLILIATISGIIGARILHVMSNLTYYLEHPTNIIAVWNGGLSLHGGIILSIISLYVYLKKYQLNIFKYFDILAPSLVLAQAIGRWGNFFNQEAFGLPTNLPFGIFIEEINRPFEFKDFTHFHPTFFYEFITNLLIFFTLIILRRKKWILTGEITLIYLMLYSIFRFLIEFLRTDSVYIFSWKLEQILSIIIIITSSIIIHYRRTKNSKLRIKN